MSAKSLNYYTNKFTKLRVDRAHGASAPHKPILLLSVIELTEQGLLKHNQIPLSAELVAAFLKLWQQLGSTAHNADIGMPFFHLRIVNKPTPFVHSIRSFPSRMSFIEGMNLFSL